MKAKLLLNPFEKIAGWPALGWGVAGLAVSTVISYYSGYHYHRMLHFGPAPADAFWTYAVEHLIVWLVPALLFYIGGLLLSKSKVRLLDVVGTVAFAQLPYILMNLCYLLPPSQALLAVTNLPMDEMMQALQQPAMIAGTLFAIVAMVFLVWSMIWMFHAFRVTCNVKGARLWIWYLLTLIVGDILCGLLIKMIY